MQNIKVKVYDLWNFFIEHIEEMADKYLLIAEWEEAGIEVYLTSVNGNPYFCVDVDGCTEYEVDTNGEEDAADNYRQILELFFDGATDDSCCDFEDDEDNYDADLERLEEICCAVDDLIHVLIEEDPVRAGFGEEDFRDIAMDIAKKIHDDYGYNIYFPGEVDGVFTRYPFMDDADSQ